jgi:hypothetical protein
VERAFLEQVRRLPTQTQRLLLIAAADDGGQLALVLRAAVRIGVAPSALGAAEEAGIVRVDAGTLDFRHGTVAGRAVRRPPTWLVRAALGARGVPPAQPAGVAPRVHRRHGLDAAGAQRRRGPAPGRCGGGSRTGSGAPAECGLVEPPVLR